MGAAFPKFAAPVLFLVKTFPAACGSRPYPFKPTVLQSEGFCCPFRAVILTHAKHATGMNSSDYRREYAAYCSTLERARYDTYLGRQTNHNPEAVQERYADLWTREAINDLQRAWSETSEHLETECAGLHALKVTAQVRFAKERAREVTSELARCESSARIKWDGAEVGQTVSRQRSARMVERSGHCGGRAGANAAGRDGRGGA